MFNLSRRDLLKLSALGALSAPTSGTYAGILFFGDRNAPGGTHRFNGTAVSDLTGAIYAPAQDVEYSGNFSGTTGCVQVVASTISWSGNATINLVPNPEDSIPVRIYTTLLVR